MQISTPTRKDPANTPQTPLLDFSPPPPLQVPSKCSPQSSSLPPLLWSLSLAQRSACLLLVFLLPLFLFFASFCVGVYRNQTLFSFLLLLSSCDDSLPCMNNHDTVLYKRKKEKRKCGLVKKQGKRKKEEGRRRARMRNEYEGKRY